MEIRDARLFRIVSTLKLFVLLLSSTVVITAPMPPSIIDVMRDDTRLCDVSKFLYDSVYIKPCASLMYPTAPLNYVEENLNMFLCLGVYDTAYKICQYSSQLQTPVNSTVFNSYVEKFIPDKQVQEEEFCKDKLQGFTSLYNRTDLLWGPLVKNLNIPRKCSKICFDLNDKFHPLCAVLAWIKSIDDDINKANRTGTRHDPVTSDIKSLDIKDANQLNRESDDKIMSEPVVVEAKSQTKENKKEDTIPKAPLENNINVQSNLSLNVQAERISSETQAHNQVHHEENTKNIATNSGPQAPSINNAAGNVPNKEVVNDANAEGSNKKQDTNDVKTSTLSENTQDYDAGNAEEDVESNMGDNTDDVDDTIQQPIDAGNQNKNLQETYEQKNNLRYPNIRTEDDTHFFTYFTVITVACIAGYIGYHNKQKILAIVLEGRRSRSNRNRRRPSTASYRKLDCTLEEAVTSQCNANVTHVIY